MNKDKEYKKITEAQGILQALGLPEAQQNRISCLTLLALCGITESEAWENATGKSMTLSKDIIEFVNIHYEADYKPNSRESFRKIALKPFVDNDIALLNPDEPNLSTTSSKTHYAISYVVLNTIKKYGTKEWDIALDNYLKYKNEIPRKEVSLIKLKSLTISGYKSIVADNIELGNFNIFIGANGCGKTNILEALAFAGASMYNDLNSDGLYSRGIRMARPDLILSSFLHANPRSSVDIDLLFETNSELQQIKCSLSPANPNDIYTKWIDLAEEESIPETLLNYFEDVIKQKPGISGEALLNEANRLLTEKGAKRITTFDNILSAYSIFDLNTKSLRGITPAESKKTPLGLNGEGLDLLIGTFGKEDREYLKKCKKFFDWLDEIVTDKDDKLKLSGLKPGRSISNLYFTDHFMQEQNNTFSAENSNEGILHVLFYLTLFISSKTPKLFAIDNIETALNPRLCQALVIELAQKAKEKNKQVLITTHNPAVLDGSNLTDDDQRLFEVYRNHEGHTKTRRIKFKSDLSDKKFKLSEMWMKGLLGAIPENF